MSTTENKELDCEPCDCNDGYVYIEREDGTKVIQICTKCEGEGLKFKK